MNFNKLLEEKHMSSVFVKVENEDSYQEEIEKTIIETGIIVEDTPRDRIEGNYNAGNSRWKRNHITAKNAIVLSDYHCEYNPSHLFFKSSISEENYVEAHHLVPMEYQ